MEVKDVLMAAKAIVTAGWNQHGITDGRGNFCLKGAIAIASEAWVIDSHGSMVIKPCIMDRPTTEEFMARDTNLNLERDAEKLVCEHLPEPFRFVELFNDHPDTTFDDVLAILDKAISA